MSINFGGLGSPVKEVEGGTEASTFEQARINMLLNPSVLEKTLAYPVVAADRGKVIHYTGAGGVALTLPLSTTVTDGFNFILRNDSAGNITLTPTGADTINGAATLDIEPTVALTVICDGVSAYYTEGQASAVDGANTALSNLSATAVNADIVPATGGVTFLGSLTKPWAATFSTGFLATTGNGDQAALGAYNGATASYKNFFTVTSSAAGSATGVIGSDVTATTQSPGNNSTKVATTAYADAAYTLPFVYTPPTSSVGAKFRVLERTATGTNYVDIGLGGSNVLSNYEYNFLSAGAIGFTFYNGSSSSMSIGVQGTQQVATPSSQNIDFWNSTIIPATSITSVLVGSSYGIYGALSIGSLHSPNTFPESGGINSNRFFYNAGTGGTGNTTGYAVANDTIYVFPVFFPRCNINQIVINIETADASGTADLEVRVFAPYYWCSSNFFAGPFLTSGAAINNISTTGEKTSSVTSFALSGWAWVAFRSDNIGTSLSLGTSSLIYPNMVQNIFGGSLSSDSKTVGYGYYISGQTFMPSTLASLSPSGIITDPVGIAVRTA